MAACLAQIPGCWVGPGHIIYGTAVNGHTSGIVVGFNTETFRETRIIGCSRSCRVVLEDNAEADGSSAGGLIGSSFATVENCFVSGDVTKSGYQRVHMVSGLIGELAGSVMHCYATGNVV